MSQQDARGDIKNRKPFGYIDFGSLIRSQKNARRDNEKLGFGQSEQKPYVFLDYGGLIMDFEFNHKTLFTAHTLALRFINYQQGCDVSFENLRKAHDQAISEYLSARSNGNLEWSMNHIIGILLKNLGLENIISNKVIAETYMIFDHRVSPMPTTMNTLPKLRKIARMGIISNMPHDSPIFELASYGLENFFSPIVLSHEAGFRKPHPAIYQEALKRAKISNPQEATFFSHDQEEVDGALAVGMQAHLAHNLGEVLTKLQSDLK